MPCYVIRFLEGDGSLAGLRSLYCETDEQAISAALVACPQAGARVEVWCGSDLIFGQASPMPPLREIVMALFTRVFAIGRVSHGTA